jgi:transcription elongation factor GreA-like protein
MMWASSPQAVHSQNIARTGQAFAVLFDSMDAGGGLFMRGKARQLDDSELVAALTIFNQRREAQLAEHLPERYFIGDGPQRLYCLEPEQLWVNSATRDEYNNIIEDKRYEVARNQFVL